MSSIQCPSHEQLRDYLTGRLPDPLIDWVTDHLDGCSACSSQLEDLESHSIQTLDHRMLSAEQFASTADLRDLVNRAVDLKNIRQEDSDSSPSRSSFATQDEDDTVTEGQTTGDRVGRYRLLERLGQGAVGDVFLAEHISLRKRVVIKLLQAHALQKEDAVQRFQREMLAIGKLDHPNLIKATDAGEADGHPFLVMEYHEGESLARFLAHRPTLCRLEDALSIVRQVALGLRHAHEQGLVHRDVKPSNVLLGADGCVKVLDLGLALITARKSSAEIGLGLVNDALIEARPADELTQYGVAVGTRSYMAPEQWQGRGMIDSRADIFGLGRLLEELLTGTPAPHPAMIEAAQQQQPWPFGLAELLDEMLAFDVEKRVANMSLVITRLEQLSRQFEPALTAELVDEVQRSNEANPGGPTSQHSSLSGARNKSLIAAASLILIVIGLASAVYLLLGGGNKGSESTEQASAGDASSAGKSVAPTRSNNEPQTANEQSSNESPVTESADADEGNDLQVSTANEIEAFGQNQSREEGQPKFLLRLASLGSLRIDGSAELMSHEDEFTIEFWYREEESSFTHLLLSQQQPGRRFGPTFGRGGIDLMPGPKLEGPWAIRIAPTGWMTRLQFGQFIGGNGIGPGSGSFFAGSEGMVNDWPGRWHHVALMQGADSASVFVDGKPTMEFTGRLAKKSQGPEPTHSKSSIGDLLIGDVGGLAAAPRSGGEICGVRISSGIRYTSETFDPPRYFTQDEKTLCLLNFSDREGGLSDLTGNERNGIVSQGSLIPF